MKNTLINYGKFVDFHNNGKEVYKDLYKTGNKQLKIGQDVLDRMEYFMPIQNFDRNKSYPLKVSLITEIMHGDVEHVDNVDIPGLD